ncbi:NAD(P)/FAD-dependent oxidoreductase [Mesohalobacter halotolerans]|uniref:FAD-binding oxidoreductase n=1 Tax=Mesohalobacter halotolerans TaxID=1883405 RepID=A0A4U5TPI2_9FLAO|nr:FAD-binding oxidoreductase [Mesohalobacter halotolerans]TKS56030.1 FAD-binding oxidoreductase [Mesohalobacter halotolerans]
MKDFLIVGSGLAGLSVARHLEFKNASFDIISDTTQQSSRIAGGIINPVAVKRMKPAWQVEEYLPYAKTFYQSINNAFQEEIYSRKILNVFVHDIEQENNWYQAYDKARLKSFISSQVFKNKNQNLNIGKIGKIKAGIIHLTTLYQCLKHHYQKQWVSETFKHDKLEINESYLTYQNVSYKHIVFCEGFGVTQNPFFNHLGIYGNKGDYLIFKSKALQIKELYKAKYFLIPLSKDLYKFGATYQRKPLNHEPSNEARSQMMEALDNMISVPYKIVRQVCGIRPTTKDRRPVVGTHKKHKNIHILNGFGSRGVMTSPKLGQKLVKHILTDEKLDPEISIRRFDAQI